MSRVTSSERIVNLLLALAHAHQPLSAVEIQTTVNGYDTCTTENAFKTMFERDREELKNNGFIILTLPNNTYTLDQGATFAVDLELSPKEIATLMVIGNSLKDDPTFPYQEDLMFALNKLRETKSQLTHTVSDDELYALVEAADEPVAPSPTTTSAHTAAHTHAPAAPDLRTSSIAPELYQQLHNAVTYRKALTFAYTNARGEKSHKTVHPYGLYSLKNTWYMVAFEPRVSDVRTYKIERMSNVAFQHATKAGVPNLQQPDFEAPTDFSVETYIGFPFEYGTENFTVTFRFAPQDAWRAPRVTKNKGTLTPQADGAIHWSIPAKNVASAAKFAALQPFDLQIVSPASVLAYAATHAQETEALHGTSL